MRTEPSTTIKTIQEPIDDQSFDKMGPFIKNLAVQPGRNDLRTHRAGPLLFVRVEAREYCINEFCLTYILLDCPGSLCPSISAFLPNKFFLSDAFISSPTSAAPIVFVFASRPSGEATFLAGRDFIIPYFPGQPETK